MSDPPSPRIPLLSQSASNTATEQSERYDAPSTSEIKRSLSKSRKRKSSLASSEHSIDSPVVNSSMKLRLGGVNGVDEYPDMANGVAGDGAVPGAVHSGSRWGRGGNNDDDEEDDLVAISGQEGLLHENNNNERSYSQINGQLTSAGRGKSDILKKITVILALIGSWFFFSTMMNLYNSWLFSSKHHNFSYPLFTTSMHMFVQFGLSSILMCACHQNRNIVPRRSNGKRAGPEPKDWVSKVVPCALATALDIGLSNLSLKTITLTFYTMCKSSNLAFVLFFAFLFKLEKLRLSLIGIITLITVGVIMMVAAETQFVLTGAVQVLTASAMGGLRWALTQMLLHKEQMGMNNPIATIFWLSPLMGAFMIISSMFLEDWWAMFGSAFFQDVPTGLKTSFLMIAPGIIAFMMNLSEFALIQRTSVMTLSVAGIFKEIATILLSSTVFGDELTPINVTGLCIALTGIGLYNYLKYRLLMRNNGLDQGMHRLIDEESCTEMGGNVLPNGSGTREPMLEGDTSRDANYTHLSGTDVQGDLTKEELERRRNREEEADMAGWHSSGIIRTGNGYDDGESDHTA